MRVAARDLDLLRFVAEREAVPASVLAEVFFRVHPKTGVPNRDPEHACRRRLTELAEAGWIVRHHDARRFVTLSSTGARRLAKPQGKAPALKNALHHAATIRAVDAVMRTLGIDGARAHVRMENAVRKERVGSRFIRRGDELDVLPDAEVVVDGDTRIAVEFVSSKYSDDQIRKKALGLTAYDRVFFFADSARTAARVSLLTNQGCQCM